MPEPLAGNSTIAWSLQQLGRFEMAWYLDDRPWPVSHSSKLGKAARGLFELQRDDGAYDAILRLAAGAAAS